MNNDHQRDMRDEAYDPISGYTHTWSDYSPSDEEDDE